MSIGGGNTTVSIRRAMTGGRRAPPTGRVPLESAAERETAQQLHALIAQLDDGQRDVVHLHYYQSLTLQETADALGIATSTVKYRLRNALDLLQARLTEPKVRI